MSHPIAEQLLNLFATSNAFLRLPYQGQRHIVPVQLRSDSTLADLLAIDDQKTAAQTNMQRFLTGAPYNHMLLWGARGTGKSSLVRALIAHFQTISPLKVLQMSSDDLEDLPFIFWVLVQNPAPFIVFIDDLSFSADDRRYRALKATLDGALNGIAANILLCVTSNRRHLLRESHDERALHPDEEQEEHISLAERFGLRLAFHPLSQAQFLAVVAHKWQQTGGKMTPALEKSALQFALARGSRSARVAAQFINTLDP